MSIFQFVNSFNFPDFLAIAYDKYGTLFLLDKVYMKVSQNCILHSYIL